MQYHDNTDMGGAGDVFLTTHWSLIENIYGNDEDRNQALIGLLLNKYWKPVYCYLRRKGYDNEQAKDLTQGFFQEVVLGRDLIQKADPSKGRFRSFLLMALNRYIINVRHEETAQKRIPKHRLLPLNEIDPPELPSEITESTPEDTFNYAWLSVLLEQIIAEVEAKCREQGLTIHWQAFYEKVIQPITDNTDPPTLSDICDKYGIEDERKASNMIITVRRRFQSALKQHVRNSVISSDEVSDELSDLMCFFPKDAQDSK
jgi:DNA-directed RNA polymerase specialized sigma24 family protein